MTLDDKTGGDEQIPFRFCTADEIDEYLTKYSTEGFIYVHDKNDVYYCMDEEASLKLTSKELTQFSEISFAVRRCNKDEQDCAPDQILN